MRPQTDGSYASSLHMFLMHSCQVPWEGHVPSPLPTLLYHVASRSATPLFSPSRNWRGISAPPQRNSPSSLSQRRLCWLRYTIGLVGETAPGEDDDQHWEHDKDERQGQEHGSWRSHREEPGNQGKCCPIAGSVQQRDDEHAALRLVEDPRPGDPSHDGFNEEERKEDWGESRLRSSADKERGQVPQSPEGTKGGCCQQGGDPLLQGGQRVSDPAYFFPHRADQIQQHIGEVDGEQE